MADLETAPIDDRLRDTIRLLRWCRRQTGGSGGRRLSRADALAVAFVFNTVDRLSRTFG